MLADLLGCLIVLPHDLIFSVAYLTLPRSKEVSKVCFAIKNAMITLNCGLTMTLTLERTKTATYLGQRRRNRLSWSLKLCLAVIWLSGMAEAVITYMSQNEDERPLLPIKLLGQATSASSHCLSTGTIIAMVLVLAAALVILVSLYHTRRFLRRLNLDAERTFQGFSKRKRRCKMQKQTTVACLASLATLAVSYLPMFSVILICNSLGRQNINANAIAGVLCSMAYTINPIIAIATSARVKRAVVSVLKLVYPFKSLLRWYPSIYGSQSSFSGESIPLSKRSVKQERSPTIPLEENLQKDQDYWAEKMTNDQAFDATPEIVIHVATAEVKKKPLTRRRSSSAGGPAGTTSRNYPSVTPEEDTNCLEKPRFRNMSDSNVYKPLKSCDD